MKTVFTTHHPRSFADLQGVPEGVRQRVPAAAAHDLARRVRRPEEIQVRRLRKGFQVQAPPQGMEFKAMPRTKSSQKKSWTGVKLWKINGEMSEIKNHL